MPTRTPLSITREAIELARQSMPCLPPEEFAELAELARKVDPHFPPSELRELIELVHAGQFGPVSDRLNQCLELTSRIAMLRHGHRGKAEVEQALAEHTAPKDGRPLEERVRGLSAKLDAVHLSRPVAPIDRLINATRNQLPAPTLPGQEEAQAVGRFAKKPLVKRVLWKLTKTGLKVAGGAALGAYAGQRLVGRRGLKVGAIAGAAGGIIFSAPETLATARAGLEFAAKCQTKNL